MCQKVFGANNKEYQSPIIKKPVLNCLSESIPWDANLQEKLGLKGFVEP
jgi:hypothetical protein